MASVPIRSQPIRLEYPQGAKVILCRHPAGPATVLALAPDKKLKLLILFSNRPGASWFLARTL